MIIKWPSPKNDLLRIFLLIPFLLLSGILRAQQDSVDAAALERMINLTEVVVRSDLDVPSFIRRIKEDTTFYKAFRNIRVLGFTSFNDIRMFNKRRSPDLIPDLEPRKTRRRRTVGLFCL